ncbi:MAG TPA: OmpA family protein [Candidatus Binatia bacterium]|nr:OmpA family protein [Candidatus Binatia bacterium]
MRSRFAPAVAVCAALLWSLPAAAVNTESYEIPYFDLGYSFLQPDSVRNDDSGSGYQLMFGVPLEQTRGAIELRFFDYSIKRFDGDKNFQTGLFGDYVYSFGAFGGGREGFFLNIKPFLNLGVGFVEEDTFAHKHLHFGVDGGGGLLVPLGFKGWAARFDARAQAQANNESCSDKPGDATWPSHGGCSGNASFLIDYQATLWLQIPLTAFFDRPVAVKPVADCPVAVVDPNTGRRDCRADSDHDGVGDDQDRCPATPAGTAVGPDGCSTAAPAVDDADRDGVKDTFDRCPGTHPGLKVDESGCVVQQTTAIPGITFQMDSAKLTPEARITLDSVADTLKPQKELNVEVAGHTDNVGSEAYNMLLSQQRADAVRAYLLEKGVEESRVTAVGYGELEPVGGNDTEADRDRNRRVELRITTSAPAPSGGGSTPAPASGAQPAPGSPAAPAPGATAPAADGAAPPPANSQTR